MTVSAPSLEMNPPPLEKKITFQVQRQEAPQASAYWDTFEVDWFPNMNVVALLQALQRFPKNQEGKQVAPVVWEAACLEEVCGACSMVINGRPRQACTALVDQLDQPIRIQPLSKFPILRDLIVDRSRMFDHLKTVKAWVESDGSHDLGPGPRMSPEVAAVRYQLSECMTCGCCLEACPQYGPQSSFIGPQAISQVRLFNLHPSGALQASQRLETLMGEGGVMDCGDAQNCVQVCPKHIPLTESIAQVSAQVTQYAWKKIWGS